jgi:hypothetical protein
VSPRVVTRLAERFGRENVVKRKKAAVAKS